MLPIKLVNGLLKITKGMKELGKDTLGYMEAQNGIVTLTDGHRLINIEDPDCGNGYYDHAAVLKASKIATIDKLKDMNISSAEMGKPECDYPRWEQLIPTNLDDCRRVAFNATYLKEMCELAIASGDTKIEMHIPKYDTDYHGNLYDCCTTPVMCFWSVGEAIGRGLLMPIQVRDAFIKWKGLLPSGKVMPKKREKVAA
jgi:hypothetical protein